MKKLSQLTTQLIAASFICIALFSCDNGTELSNQNTYKVNFTPAKTNAELAILRANKNYNIVRTLAEFDKIIEHKQSAPLAKLPTEVVAEFRKGLVVRDGVGIVAIKAESILNTLNEDEFNEVMAMFGLDIKKGFWGWSKDPEILAKMNIRGGRIATDYEGYWCENPHNCKKFSSAICLSGC